MPKIYRIPKTITDEQIHNVINDALDHGSTYWMDQFEDYRAKNKPDGYYSAMALTHGGFIMVHDLEGEKWHYLTLKKVLKGFALSHIDPEDYDGDDADQVLQNALFGEVVYG
jgi:hypothetical protein